MNTAASSGPGNVTGYAIPIATALAIADDIEAGRTTGGIELGIPGVPRRRVASGRPGLRRARPSPVCRPGRLRPAPGSRPVTRSRRSTASPSRPGNRCHDSVRVAHCRQHRTRSASAGPISGGRPPTPPPSPSSGPKAPPSYDHFAVVEGRTSPGCVRRGRCSGWPRVGPPAGRRRSVARRRRMRRRCRRPASPRHGSPRPAAAAACRARAPRTAGRPPGWSPRRPACRTRCCRAPAGGADISASCSTSWRRLAASSSATAARSVISSSSPCDFSDRPPIKQRDAATHSSGSARGSPSARRPVGRRRWRAAWPARQAATRVAAQVTAVTGPASPRGR